MLFVVVFRKLSGFANVSNVVEFSSVGENIKGCEAHSRHFRMKGNVNFEVLKGLIKQEGLSDTHIDREYCSDPSGNVEALQNLQY